MISPGPERPEWLGTLTDALAEKSRLERVVALRPGVGARPAAVLILIGAGPEGPEIMFV
jgi:hypothetical protein